MLTTLKAVTLCIMSLGVSIYIYECELWPRKEICASSGIMPLKVMSEKLKVSVSQGYKDPWCFKLMVVKNESDWSYCTVSVWSSCCSTVSQEKVNIFWKWHLHRWQIPLSVQIRLSKTKQPLSQRKKTNFPRIQPFFLPPFPPLLVHCQLTTSSALTLSGS